MAQPQFGNPTITVDQGTWSITGAPTVHEALDEGLPGDDATTYVQSVLNPVNETFKVGGLGLTDPGTDRGHRPRVKVAKNVSAPVVDFTVGLRKADGTLVGSEFTITPTSTNWAWGAPLLTEAAISALAPADYPDLQIWVTANKVSGANVNARVTMVQLEAPSDATFRSPPAGVFAGHEGYWTADGLSGFLNNDPVDWLFDEDSQGKSWRQTIAGNRPTYLSSVPEAPGAWLSFRRAVARQFLRTNWDLIPQPFTWVLHVITRIPAPSVGSALLGADDISVRPAAFNILLATTAESGHPESWGLNAEQAGAHIFTPDNSRDDGVPTVIAGEYNATSRIIHEGVEKATGATGTDPSGRYRLGDSEHTAQDRAGNFDFHCALWYPLVLTDAQLTDTSVALLAEGGGDGNGRMTGGAIRKPPRVKQSR